MLGFKTGNAGPPEGWRRDTRSGAWINTRPKRRSADESNKITALEQKIDRLEALLEKRGLLEDDDAGL